MQIEINKTTSVPLYVQISDFIMARILSGEYYYGFKLPSERELSLQLKVNRSTIIKSFDTLKSENLVTSRSGKGTTVCYKRPEQSQLMHRPILWDHLLSQYSSSKCTDIMQKLMDNDSKDKSFISFSSGSPSYQDIPGAEIKSIMASLFQDNQIFKQMPVQGNHTLIEQLKRHLSKRDFKIATKNILVTTGAQQGLDLIIRTFINQGDNVLIETPSFFGATQALIKAKATIHTFNALELDFDYIQHLLETVSFKFIYLMPSFQNPSGHFYSLEQKIKFLKLANQYGVPIIEEDPYGELCYMSEPLKPIKALDHKEKVIYISTFSKTLAPGLRVGYVVANEDVIKKLITTKEYSDIHSSSISQHLIAALLKEGIYDAHVSRVCALYQQKRDLMVDSLKQNKTLSYDIPAGGYYIWVTLPHDISVKSLLNACMKNGVDFVPGEFFGIYEGEHQNKIRLNFTYEEHQRIVQGMDLFLKTLKQLGG